MSYQGDTLVQVLVTDEQMYVESPKPALRCPLVKEGVTTGVSSNNKWF